MVFSETSIAGYPLWIWRLRPGSDWGPSEQLHARLVENAVDIGAGELAPLCEAARRHRVVVVCGLNERDGRSSRSTLYNTVVIIGDQGEILNRHCKLMPINPERMVWGMGDASGLRVVETPAGRLSTLMCWENYMPLARYALYAQGVELYIAPIYDSGADWLGSLQHIAREGCCWVIGCGTVIEARDLPDDLPDRRQLYPDSD
ncbi:Carbon-nitrogen hydrolase [endosymbiont of Ridgeia piscesae]|uniref:Carbon-nitrogen hydrolase n=1 Tax=endosymbiont of Ridgeia piscesae TaxID=54398 RepID=A0A0T5YV14_9GAMM|nr:Carbon-nitrogen hydrolase [endosymbiont of Ridgeia piscesae]KRT58702.1 Carbon-nitrogen hydrolase [endosymbiont of Ridgeia piscesae]